MSASKDVAYMEMAFGLAEKARGRTSPNPMVGAVVVNRDRVVGWGFHERAGGPHAEIIALERAGAAARGATLYVTLEPCTHWGKTPPCVDRVLAAGLSRVVVASRDPNPVVNGKGIARLKRAGLAVTTGVLGGRHERLNEAHIKFITTRLPFVTVKAALSLDGKIAARTGDARWVSSPASREYAHLLRGENDAVLVGIGTVAADDPRLTVRHRSWGRKSAARVILDPELDLPAGAAVLKTLDRGPVLVFTAKGQPPEKRRRLESAGAELVEVESRVGRLDLGRVLAELGRRELISVLVEGGSRVITSFIEGRLADKAFLFLCPKLVGGETSPGLLGGRGVERMAEAMRLKKTRQFRLDGDIILEGYF
jgi:diaminohydroxyphosphoribosylaminopyrimidine deaminase/5-amino-6-(5-phosphoribosylamino)uracil reductase